LRGDALLAEFERASDAVTAALAFQVNQVDCNSQFDDNIQPTVRVGIAMGEVIIADNTITGAGVVLAQRLEQLSKPGRVVIQGAAYETIPGRFPFEFENLGEQVLKGFDQPVRVYAVSLESGGVIPESHIVAEPETSATDLPEKTSIAVLPFINMSDDPKQEYFSEGVTQDIITTLSKIPRLSVVVRTPQLNDQSKNLNQFAPLQDVRYSLEGSVRKDGNRIRVSVQLIEVNTGNHVWAERYDRELDDIFSVQDDITHHISIEMRIRLSEGEKMRVLAGRTKSVEAWERLLKADELTNTLIHEDNLKARRLLEEAVQLDPHYAAAWTQLANTFVGDVFMGRSDSREDSLEKALNAANKALEVEEGYPTALTILGYVNLFRGDYDSAVGLMRKAVAREPRNAEIIATCAYAMVYADLLDDALEFIRRAIELSPISPMWYFVCLGMCYHARGENELAISTLREAIAMEPGSALARPYIISALVEAGLVDEAKQIAREVIRIEPSFTLSRWPGANFKNVAIKAKITSNLIEVGLLE
jgi:adenylate cyclase